MTAFKTYRYLSDNAFIQKINDMGVTPEEEKTHTYKPIGVTYVFCLSWLRPQGIYE